MNYYSKYNSKIGEITLISDGYSLTHLYIENQTHPTIKFEECVLNDNLEIFKQTKNWLNEYFNKQIPRTNIKIKLQGSKFSKEVWEILKTIPYGKVITYKDIAEIIASKRNIKRMSCQAVGNAVGRNPTSIIIPCHRVIGSNGTLTGYNGGIDMKEKLLEIENISLKTK